MLNTGEVNVGHKRSAGAALQGLRGGARLNTWSFA